MPEAQGNNTQVNDPQGNNDPAGSGVDGQETPLYQRPLQEAIPEELREDKTLQNFRTVGDALKGLVDTKKMVGQQQEGMVKIPDQNASAEDQAAFRAAIGVPEAAEAYELPDLPEGQNWDDTLLGGLRQVAHENNVPNGAFKAMADAYMSHQQQQLSQFKDQLIQQYGDEEKLNAAVEAGKSGIDRIGIPDEQKEQLKGYLGVDPLFTMFAEALSKNFQESRSPDHGVQSDGSTTDSLEAELDRLEKSDAYNNRAHPEHAQAINRVYEIEKKLMQRNR